MDKSYIYNMDEELEELRLKCNYLQERMSNIVEDLKEEVSRVEDKKTTQNEEEGTVQ